MNKLKLERPIVFFDLETTGTDPLRDRIVEIAMIKIHPDGKEESYRRLVNPGRPIPEAATELHHISDADVAEMPRFEEVAKEVVGFIADADLGGYNCNRFDIPLLVEELLAAGVVFDLSLHKVVDVQVIFHKKEQRTLSAAYQFYCGKSLENAHTADADTRATYEVLLGQLEKYDDVPTDVPALDEYTKQRRTADLFGRLVYDDKDEIVFNFGKYRGRSVRQVIEREDPKYFDWMMGGDFPRSTKQVLWAIKEKKI